MHKTILEVYDWAITGPWYENAETDTEWKYRMCGESYPELLEISFQGSSEFFKDGELQLDWKQNFNFFAKAYRTAKPTWLAHRGFIKKWKSIEKDLYFIINKYRPGRISITGFSQGAAIATLAHEAIWFKYPEYRNRLNTVVFGSPRVLWFWNLKKIRERWDHLTRFENGMDIVVGIPWWLMGFRHVGKKAKTNKKPRWPKLSVRDHLNYRKYL